ncbi:hypothetical protein Aph01nite_54350 [Acrocarpospora phusangensis]|uniref:Colicin D immunity protein domain-containing protein n=1 Tax=Acrocarpospora phusangensis TaxID=1070424 RepID=A0A919UT56_9ACTN|nr:hypothetical protein Aph01nite_54350 [Acrocarpospora phusangensis]
MTRDGDPQDWRRLRLAWACPAQVPSGTGVARQFELMNLLVQGKISTPAFARDWLSARRTSLDNGERLRESFERAMNNVFYLLDNYSIDPSLRNPSDVSDEALIEGVRYALEDLSALDGKYRDS